MCKIFQKLSKASLKHHMKIQEEGTYHVSHEEFVSTITHAQSPFHEGHNSVHGVHVSPLQVVLENKRTVN